WGKDWDVRSGHVFPLFGWRRIANVRQQVRFDAREIEQSVALGRCAIGGHTLTRTLSLDQEHQEVVLDSFGARLKLAICLQRPQSEPFLRNKYRRHSPGLLACILCMTSEDTQATAVRG